MKMILALAALAAMTGAASAQYGGSSYGGGTGSNPNSHSVQGYTRNDGTYVAPHQQTNPNGTQHDNYGTSPNVNPYNGQTGTRRARD